jgi:hypothetical protein
MRVDLLFESADFAEEKPATKKHRRHKVNGID